MSQLFSIVFQLAGALALFMYGMQLASDGIQRAAGERLQRTVNFMTKNTLFAILTGAVVTILLQSSSAATVMVVSFANAGLLGLVQAVGVIMGSNIGTTLTGWLIAAAGVAKFSILSLAVPVFGIGYMMTLSRRSSEAFRSYGESLMGFALIFLGLNFLSKAIPTPSGDALLFLQTVSTLGWLTTAICIAAGMVFTMLVRASSATLAVAIGLASKGVIDFPMAAAITLGANIGTTIDSWLLSLRSNTNAKRAAWAHICFNLLGTAWVVILFRPFLFLVDLAVPVAISPASMGAHLAMLHTLFNTINTVVLFPFTRHYAAFISKLIKDDTTDTHAAGLHYVAAQLVSSPELNLVSARKEIADMAGLAKQLFASFRANLAAAPESMADEVQALQKKTAYADAMHQELSRFLLEVAQQNVAERTRDTLGIMMRVVNELDNITDACLSLGLLLERRQKKKLQLDPDEIAGLEPYTGIVEQFLDFVQLHINETISDSELNRASELEKEIDSLRDVLKKKARKRLKKGADVKTELLFIDMIRYIEKIGDYAWAIAEALGEARRL